MLMQYAIVHWQLCNVDNIKASICMQEKLCNLETDKCNVIIVV